MNTTPTPPPAAPATTAMVIERLKAIQLMANHCIPFYAYGDNEAACDMGNRLEYIYGELESAITHLTALSERCAALEEDGKRLDWLDKNRNWWAPGRHVDGYEQISRAAIDAARPSVARLEEDGKRKTMHIGRTDAIADELSRVMKENGVSQADLARKLKLSRQLISRWLDPKNETNFVASTLQMIAEAIGAEVIVSVKNAARPSVAARGHKEGV